MVERLETADIVCIVIYFVAVLAVGLWSTFRPNRGNATGYFLAGKTMHWFLRHVQGLVFSEELHRLRDNFRHHEQQQQAGENGERISRPYAPPGAERLKIGCSIFASNVGAPMFIGLAGTAAASGFAVVIYEWHAVYLLIALGWVFVPVYVASGAFTMPEYLKKRFGGVRLRVFLSVLSLVLYVLTKISGEIYSGAIFMNQLLGVNIYIAISIILVVTAVYTVAGGLAAVIYTDTLQTIILVFASTILFFICIIDIGGWSVFVELYRHSASNLTLSNPHNLSCGLPRSDFEHIWRDPVDGDIPWTGAVFGLTTLGLWNWCTDQIIVQRCLSAKNMSHAKGGCILGAGLKILSFFLFIVPGMISRFYFPDEVACSTPESCKRVCDNEAGCSNIAYPLLVLRKMPTGLRGIILSALMAALMSSLTSIFNSASSMFTLDIWRRFRSRARQSELMIVGRVCVIVLVGLSIVWIPIMEKSQGGQLWNYLQTITACLSPPWCWVFLLALFWQGTTEQGAFWGLIISTGAGVVRMVLEFSYQAPFCGSGEEDTRPDVLKKVNFLHFAIISSGVSILSTVLVSLCTKRRSPEKLRRVTWWTRHDPLPPEESDSEDDFGLDENDEDVLERATRPAKLTKGRRVYNWMCGQDTRPVARMTQEQKERIKQKMTDISETDSSRQITTMAAIFISILGAFLLGFFS